MFLRLGSVFIHLEMWNPLHTIVPLVLLVFSIPLAIFAIFTTSIGVTVLSLRALVVYFQLATAIIAAWLTPASPKLPVPRYTTPPSTKPITPTKTQNRYSSDASSAFKDTFTTSTTPQTLRRKSDSLTALVGTSGITQDFEGVGGWRVTADDEEEALWMGANPRKHRPVEASSRRHQRSLTGGASPNQRWSFSPEAFRMSPVQSRSRTPLRYSVDGEHGYFPQQPVIRHHTRRKSGSSSSSGPAATGNNTAVKEAGE